MYQQLGSGELAQLQSEDEQLRRRQQMAQAFQQAGFNPVQGGNNILSLLTAVASTLKGNSMMKDTDAKLSENLAKTFEFENQRAQAEAEAKQRESEQAYQRDINKLELGEKFKSQYAQRNIDKYSPEGIAAQLQIDKNQAGLRPQGGPGKSESERKIEQLRSLGATDEQILAMLLGNSGGSAPSGYRQTQEGNLEAIPGGPADKPAGPDPKAAAIGQVNDLLTQLEGSLDSSGPIDRWVKPSGSQKFDATVAQLVPALQTVTRVAGSGDQGEKELALLLKGMPSVGNYDATNKQQIENIRAYMNRFTDQAGQAQGAPPAAAPPSAQGAPQGPPPIGSVVTIGGKQYRATGDPADPDMVPL